MPCPCGIYSYKNLKKTRKNDIKYILKLIHNDHAIKPFKICNTNDLEFHDFVSALEFLAENNCSLKLSLIKSLAELLVRLLDDEKNQCGSAICYPFRFSNHTCLKNNHFRKNLKIITQLGPR